MIRQHIHPLFARIVIALAVLSLACPTVSAQSGEGVSAIAQPVKPVEIDRSADLPPENLQAKLLPMRQEELKGEVDAWLELVREKSLDIARSQITLRQAEGEQADPLREELVALSRQKNKLVQRAAIVVEAYEAKGGDAEMAEAYLEAVSGVDVDVTDIAAVRTYMYNWMVSPDGGIAVGLNILKFLVVLFIAWIIALIVSGIVRRALNRMKKTSQLLREFSVSITRKVILIVGFIIALSMLGLNITPLVAALAAAGLVIGLALQGTLSNFASGVLILIYRPFDMGDTVEVAGQFGKVHAMTLVNTTLMTFDNRTIIVPNNEVWNNVITSLTAMTTRRVDMVFGISYDDDIDVAKAMLYDIASSHELTLADPPPAIWLNELGDSSVNFLVRPWSKTEDYWTVYWDVQAEVKRRFDRANITIPYPQMDVHMSRKPQTAEK